MAFKSDKQRKAVMAKLRGRTTSSVIPIILPLRIITSNVIKKGISLKGQRKRNKNNPTRRRLIAFSYIDGRRLGEFNTPQDVFKKFPEERTPFNQVMKFNRIHKVKLTTLRQLEDARRRIKTFKQEASSPRKKKTKKKITRFVQSIYD